MTPSALNGLHCVQEASHVMVQRAAQLEIDLDQTAAMLCHELEDAAERNTAMQQLNGHLAWERENSCMAMTGVSILYAELQQKACNLKTLQHELFITKVSCRTRLQYSCAQL